MKQVIKVYAMYSDSQLNNYLGHTQFDESTISFEQFKWNREQTYNNGNKIHFVFKTCYTI